MPVLGITGGVATGKSTFTRQLTKWLPSVFFDADQAARELLEGDLAVQNEILSVFGLDVLDEAGGISRVKLRELVFRDQQRRGQLEAILHPRIRQKWSDRAIVARSAAEWFIVDIPLLFETGVEGSFDVIGVVACSAATQLARLVSERRLSAEIAERIVASQQSLSSKVARADHVIWSDAPAERLSDQARVFAGYLQQCYG